MANIDQLERLVLGDFGNDRFELAGEFDFGFDEIKLANSLDGSLDGWKLLAERFGQVE